MVDFSTVFSSVLTMLLLILPGFILRKINFVNAQASKVCSLIVLYCAQPAMLIDAYMREFDSGIFTDMLKVALLALIMYMSFILISSFMFKKAPDSKRPILKYMMIFSNCGFMGYPVLRQIYGEQGDLAVLLGASVTLWFNLLSWPVGVRLYDKNGESFWRSLLKPGVVATLLGLALFLTSAVKIIPQPAASAISLLSDMVTPLSMFVIGIRLAECPLKSLFSDWRLLCASGMRLIILPFVAFLIILAVRFAGLPMSDMVMAIPFILLAMPSGANTAMMAERYDGDSVYGSMAVSLTTLLSIITIPLMSLLLTLL